MSGEDGLRAHDDGELEALHLVRMLLSGASGAAILARIDHTARQSGDVGLAGLATGLIAQLGVAVTTICSLTGQTPEVVLDAMQVLDLDERLVDDTA